MCSSIVNIRCVDAFKMLVSTFSSRALMFSSSLEINLSNSWILTYLSSLYLVSLFTYAVCGPLLALWGKVLSLLGSPSSSATTPTLTEKPSTSACGGRDRQAPVTWVSNKMTTSGTPPHPNGEKSSCLQLVCPRFESSPTISETSVFRCWSLLCERNEKHVHVNQASSWTGFIVAVFS